ncbi:MAG: large conductance mechanosensitive channel protein MscL [Clostridia bacterium]|nr:large conductance mechanosensitive channel protein MscL [Clostridia bacterium]
MKKFFGEFKTFITRGNIVDMAVGVIVGGAFTGVVNGLSNFILKPIINWILSLMLPGEGLAAALTFFPDCKVYKDVVDEAGVVIGQEVDLANSIYIDWGSFISAIINFILIALVLFMIVRIINRVRAKHEKMANLVVNGKVTKEEKKEMKAQGLNYRSTADVEVFRAQKQAAADKAAKEAAEAAALERLNNPTTEDLLKKICTILENK